MRPSAIVRAMSVLCLALAACNQARVEGGPTSRIPGDGPRTRLPRQGSSVAPASGTMRYVCRGQTPSGWIAVNYIEDNEVCATGATISYRYATAVIVPLKNVAIGGSIEVCAAERIPPNFSHVQLVAGDSRCPAEKPAADPAIATVRVIQRNQ
jgi:hypothetical protein